jgi:phenylalanyl-tRNA synthetase alpha chain
MADAVAEWKDRVRAVRGAFEDALRGAEDLSALQAVRDRFLGRKKGAVTELLKTLGRLPPEERREAGQQINALRDELEARLGAARERAEEQTQGEQLRRERVDVTLPGRVPSRGRRHPLTVTREALEDIFLSMGYEIYDGPEVDDDYHCFEALNMPPDHPARDMQDTFYLKDRPGLLLRTHRRSCGSSARERSSGATTTSRIRRCSSRSRDWWSGPASAWAT